MQFARQHYVYIVTRIKAYELVEVLYSFHTHKIILFKVFHLIYFLLAYNYQRVEIKKA